MCYGSSIVFRRIRQAHSRILRPKSRDQTRIASRSPRRHPNLMNVKNALSRCTVGAELRLLYSCVKPGDSGSSCRSSACFFQPSSRRLEAQGPGVGQRLTCHARQYVFRKLATACAPAGFTKKQSSHANTKTFMMPPACVVGLLRLHLRPPDCAIHGSSPTAACLVVLCHAVLVFLGQGCRVRM